MTVEPAKPIRRRSAPAAPAGGPAEARPTEVGDLVGLFDRVSRGDERAFSELYDHLAPLVYGIARKVVRDEVQAQEVAQEVFLELWRLAPRFDAGRGSVKGWAAMLAHRRAVDRVRSEQAARARDERDGRMATAEVDVVAEEVDDRFERDRVRRALRSLPALQRQAVVLAYFGGHTYREVAALLGAPEGTIKSRIRDGVIRLRDELGVAT